MRTTATLLRVLMAIGPVALASIAAAGDEQRPRPAVGAPDESVRFDPLYFQLAASTGGDFYFWVPGEFGTTTAMPLLGTEELVIAHGEASAVRELAIPVDAGLARFDVFAGVQARARIELLDPGGRKAEDLTSGVTLQRTRLMLLASIERPSPGTWTLRLGGSGLFSASARGTPGREGEPVVFLGFAHVAPGGRPGHEGLFEMREPPPPGGTALCRVRLDGARGPIAVDFLAGDGEPLGIAAEALAEGGESVEGEWLGRCPVPLVPHRVRVTGHDATGAPFQRVQAALHDPAEATRQQR